MRKPEILAPAGSMDSLKAAVAAGCDAVYMGGPRFGARAYADNPDEENMVEAIRYCHLHQVKLYMTVNTLLKPEELQELVAYMQPYYEAGLDAAIVQDMGVLRVLHHHFPKLELHVSTQMSLTQGKQLDERLGRYGVTRIVPARELSLEELQQMRQDTKLEMEVFVHGALCYCYSGQCLMSSMQGGRSGNRGRCAQPCRMCYEVDGKHSYVLSPRELCALPVLGQMIEAGIDSFKIEGRMKRPEYTAFVTAMYRKYTDLYCSLGKERFVEWKRKHDAQWQADLRHLAELYNREGFTCGYLTGDKKDMLASRRPKHGGVLVGTVQAVERGQACFRLVRDIHAQDVLGFRREDGTTLYEYTVGQENSEGNQVWARFQKGSGIRKGDQVYRTKHAALLEDIRQRYLKEEVKIPVEGRFVAKAGQVCTLQYKASDQTICVQGQDIVEEATKQATSAEQVERILKQTGTTPFQCDNVQMELDDGLFLPVGMIKKLRREALEQLEERLSSRGARTWERVEAPESLSCGTQEKQPISAAVMTEEQCRQVLLDEKIGQIILRMDGLTLQQIMQGMSEISAAGRQCILALPAILRKADYERYHAWWKEHDMQPDGYLIRNQESYTFLAEEVGVDPAMIRLDANLYVVNDEAAEWWKEQGVSKFTASWELTAKELASLSDRSAMQWICYGRIPLMVTAQCVCKSTRGCKKHQKEAFVLSFQGDKGRGYQSVNYCEHCYNIIYKEEPFWIDLQKEKAFAEKWGGVRYEFTTETPEQIQQILRGKKPFSCDRGHFDKGIL